MNKYLKNFKIQAHNAVAYSTQPKAKKDKEAGNLSPATVTALEEYLLEAEFQRIKYVSSPAIVKGKTLEDKAIEEVSKKYNKKYKKNTKTYRNEFAIGTPDIVTPEYVRDIKTSQDIFTFPMYRSEFNKSDKSNKRYYWQLQVYMWLTNTKKAYLDFVLIDSPEWLLTSELRKHTFIIDHQGLDPEQEEKQLAIIENSLTRQHKVEKDIPLDRRVRTYEIQRSDKDIELLQKQVINIRNYKI